MSKERIAAGHLTDPVDRRLARLIARSMRIPGRHGFSVLFGEFMQRGYEAVKQLPKADRLVTREECASWMRDRDRTRAP